MKKNCLSTYISGIKFKKDKQNHDYEDDESESGFSGINSGANKVKMYLNYISDVLKYVRKDEKKTGKIKKKKGKKTIPSSK